MQDRSNSSALAIYKDIKNNAWVTVNNYFCVTSEAICQRWKSLANRITSDPKIVIRGNECIILFLTRCFMSWTHNSAKNNHWSLISQLSPGTVVSDLALWCHHSGSVTSREREILALWRHLRRLFSHAQIGTNWRSSLVNNNREYRFLITRYSGPSV